MTAPTTASSTDAQPAAPGAASGSETYDVAVIGAGPGGYVAAIRGAQLGLRVALIERADVGGVCLNWGCIPSKALLQSAGLATVARRGEDFGVRFTDLELDLGRAVDRSRELAAKMVGGVQTLLDQHGVTVVSGSARLLDARNIEVAPGGERIEARHVVLATGARPRSLPGVAFDGDRVLSSREALELRDIPASIAIVGGGPVGVEFAYIYRAFGSDVTLIEALPRLLPGEDEEICRVLERSLRVQGIDVRTGAAVGGLSVSDGGVAVHLAGFEEPVQAERALVGVGVEANSADLGLEAAGVETADGFVRADDFGRTNVDGVFAIGDLTGRAALAHLAMAQGVTAIELIAGREPAPIAMEAVPHAVYCQPQMASIGLTEEAAQQRGRELRTGRFPFRANGKAAAIGETEGLVKLVFDAITGDMLGCHIVGHDATELLASAAVGRALETTPEDFAQVMLPHPTLSEAVREAALAATGEAVHFVDRRARR